METERKKPRSSITVLEAGIIGFLLSGLGYTALVDGWCCVVGALVGFIGAVVSMLAAIGQVNRLSRYKVLLRSAGVTAIATLVIAFYGWRTMPRRMYDQVIGGDPPASVHLIEGQRVGIREPESLVIFDADSAAIDSIVASQKFVRDLEAEAYMQPSHGGGSLKVRAERFRNLSPTFGSVLPFNESLLVYKRDEQFDGVIGIRHLIYDANVHRAWATFAED